MSTSKPHLSSVEGRSEDGKSVSQAALRRDVALAVLVGALVLAGLNMGGGHDDPQIAQAQSGPSAAEPTIYFPSQFINRGVDLPNEIPTF